MGSARSIFWWRCVERRWSGTRPGDLSDHRSVIMRVPVIAGTVVLAAMAAISAQTPAPPLPTRTDFPPSNPARDIADALSQAKHGHKYVLLDFGADWCVDCRVLETALRSSTIQPFMRLHYVVVHIDVGEFFKSG